jgi:hypothetical protein
MGIGIVAEISPPFGNIAMPLSAPVARAIRAVPTVNTQDVVVQFDNVRLDYVGKKSELPLSTHRIFRLGAGSSWCLPVQADAANPRFSS